MRILICFITAAFLISCQTRNDEEELLLEAFSRILKDENTKKYVELYQEAYVIDSIGISPDATGALFNQFSGHLINQKEFVEYLSGEYETPITNETELNNILQRFNGII